MVLQQCLACNTVVRKPKLIDQLDSLESFRFSCLVSVIFKFGVEVLIFIILFKDSDNVLFRITAFFVEEDVSCLLLLFSQ